MLSPGIRIPCWIPPSMSIPALAPGKTFSLSYRAVATLGGTLRSGPSVIEGAGHRFHVPPSEWTIK